jgi:hypothetical protein
MRDHGNRNNVGRACQPRLAEHSAPLGPRLSQVGVSHTRDLHPYERFGERPDTALPFHRVRQSRGKCTAPAREIQIARWGKRYRSHRRTEYRGGAAV